MYNQNQNFRPSSTLPQHPYGQNPYQATNFLNQYDIKPQNSAAKQSSFISPMRNYPQQSPNKSFSSNFNQQYEELHNNRAEQVNVDYNLKRGAQISELEMILEGERRKFKEFKDGIEAELCNERKQRIDMENKLIRLKDESMKREIYNKELDYKVNTIQQENQAVLQENSNLKDEMLRMQDLYNQKIRELEDKIGFNIKNQQSIEEKSRNELQRIKVEYEAKLDDIGRQADLRIKGLDEKCKNLIQIKSDLESEIRRLNDIIMKIKIDAEEEMRERIRAVQEEEYSKQVAMNRQFEMQLKALDEQKEAQIKKNQMILQQLQSKEQEYIAYENEISKLKQLANEYNSQIGQAYVMRDKLKNDCQAREAQIQRYEAEFAEFHRQAQLQTQHYQKQYDEMFSQHQKEKRQLEEIRDQQAKKLMDQDRVMRQMEAEIDRQKKIYEQMTSNLHSDIQRTIQQNVSKNLGYRYNEEASTKPSFNYKYQ